MRTYSYNVNGAQYDVTIESIQGQMAKLSVNGVSFDVEMLGTPLTEGQLPAVEATVSAAPAAAPTAAPSAPAAAPAKGAAGAGTPVKAPLPGVVTKVLVAAGQSVKKGDTVVVDLNEHYAGKALVARYDYTYKGTALQILWKAVLRDGSHYLRTEMELTGVDDVDM